MADKKISELDALTGAAVATDDQLIIVDTSAGLTKNITIDEFKNALDTSTGFVRITGDTMTGNLSFGDNDKAIFGAGSDLQVYHDTSASYISEQGVGPLNLLASQLNIYNATETSQLAQFNTTSSKLFHNNAEKLATTSTGIDVTGTVTADGLTVDGNATLQGTGDVTLTLASDTDNSGEDDSPTIIMTQDGGSHYGHVGVNGQANTKFTGAVSNTPYIYSGVGFQVATNAKVSARPSITVGSTGDISFYEDTGTTAKFFWDASAESLGIGTSSPSSQIHISSSSGATLRLERDDTTITSGNIYGNILFTGNDASSGASGTRASILVLGEGTEGQAALTFKTAGSGTAAEERLRIDSSGNLLVGKTSADLTTTGIQLNNGGFISASRPDVSGVFNRRTTDGEIVQFRKDGSTVGSIGVTAGRLTVGGGDTGLRFVQDYDEITPWNPSTNGVRDAAIDLGSSANRFKDLYLSGGVYLGGTDADHKLDDYETGEFDVTATPLSSGTVTLQSANNRASYTKVGRLVHCSGFFIVDSVSSPVGSELRMTLPFAAGQGGDQSLRVGMPIVYYDGSSDTVKPAIVIETESILKIIMDCSTIASGDAFYYGFTYQSA